MKELFFEIQEPEPLIEQMVQFSDLARKKGLLKVVELLPDIKATNSISTLLVQGLQMVIDGTDPELVRDLLETRAEAMGRNLKYRWLVWKKFLLESYPRRKARPAEIAFEHLLYRDHPENPLIVENLNTLIEKMFPLPENPGQTLKENPAFQNSLVNSCLRLFFSDSCSEPILESFYETYKDQYFTGVSIAINSCLSIQSGDNPRIARDQLNAYTGQVLLETAKSYSPKEPDTAAGSEDDDLGLGGLGDAPTGDLGLSELNAQPSYALESFLFNTIMAGIDNLDLQKILRELDTREIARALKDTKEHIIERVFSNLSQRAAEIIKEEMRDMVTLENKEIADAQKYILRIIQKLEERGEIDTNRQEL